MDKNKSKKKRLTMQNVIRTIGIITVILIVAYILKEHSPKILQMVEDGNIGEIDDYIRSQGSRGAIVMILLQCACTITIVLPLFPIYICDGIIFGYLIGILMCYATNVTMNFIILKFARAAKHLTDQVLGAHQNAWLDDLLRQTKHPGRVFLFASMIPVIPNGLIPFVASRTSVSAGDYIKAIAVGCLPGTVVFIIAGNVILKAIHNPRFLIFLIVLIVVGIVLFLKYRKKIAAAMGPYIQKHMEEED
ncbi:MAG: VTT domain-containing protein [Eubacteriales bacterium]|nr:VTT domain-containing protein [Eubacteriales bacterium]